ncbi:MAG: outer membrane beta-barrel domain-containing protein [Halioglobus sp.]|nr:outer membrane beta-barrel domain-containing protein [Halioglobus sp.]
MENRHKRVLLTASLVAALLGAAPVAGQGVPTDVIDPQVERRDIDPAAIDSENIEVGIYAGMLSIQDFNSELVYGLRAAWHISEDIFLEASYGLSEGDLTSFEKLSGGAPLFEDAERDYEFYNLGFGWNALPGEIFLFGGRALKSDLYLFAGAGSTEFLDDRWFTASVGVGYRLLLNDWLAWRIDVRDHLFDRDTFGDSEITNNIELSSGFTVFF